MQGRDRHRYLGARTPLLVLGAVAFLALTAGCEEKTTVEASGLPQSVAFAEASEVIRDRLRVCSAEFYRAWVQVDVSLLREGSDAVSVHARFLDADGTEDAETFSLPSGAEVDDGGSFRSWALEHAMPGGAAVERTRFCTDWVEFEIGPVEGATEGRLSWTFTARGEFLFNAFNEPQIELQSESR